MGGKQLGLVGDIGATNARFALVAADGSLSQHANLLCEDYPGLADAIDAYLSHAGTAPPARAVLAVATPPKRRSRRLHEQPVDVLGCRAH